MSLIVQKFGGTSLATIDRIRCVAEIIAKKHRDGDDVVVVVSAMHGETDRLIGLAKQISDVPDPREYDALVSTGENVSATLLAMMLQKQGLAACSLTSRQVRILTSSSHQCAQIMEVATETLSTHLANKKIPVVTGFQGMNSAGDVTTLGRGGSDITAVAIAAALKADECQIYTDVEGVYTSDPNVVCDARCLDEITYTEMLALSSLGANVLHRQAVEFAKKHAIPVRVLSSFKQGVGTLISVEKAVEKPWVSGVAFDKHQAKFSILGIPKKPNTLDQVIKAVDSLSFEVDMTVQNFSNANDTVDFSFTVHADDYQKAVKFSQEIASLISAREVVSNNPVAKLSLVGQGMKSHAGVASKIFQALGAKGIDIYLITSSEAKISTVIDAEHMEAGAQLLHTAFDLGSCSGALE